MWNIEDKINAAVFPGLQGGPRNQSITALAIALKQAQSPVFREYQEQVMKNSQALVGSLKGRGFDIVSGGTANHLCLIDLRSKGVNGSKSVTICEQVSIVLNKNTIPGDKSAMNPNGLRVGAPAMTSRGLIEKDFETIGGFLAGAVDIAVAVQKQSGPKLVEYRKVIKNSPPAELLALKA